MCTYVYGTMQKGNETLGMGFQVFIKGTSSQL